MKIIIGFISLFWGICTFDAYAATGSSYDQYTKTVNQELDQIEKIVSQQIARQDPLYQETPPNPVSEVTPLKPVTQESQTFAFNGRVNDFSINTHIFYSHYAEPQKARTVKGIWEGIEGKYIFRPPQGNFLNTPVVNYYAIEGLYASGENKIADNNQRDSDKTYTKLVIKRIPGYMFENRILLGRDFIPTPSVRLTPYTGFGIRYKTDHSAGHYNIVDYSLDSPVVILGYDFSDLYYYVPTGLTLDLAANNDYELSANIEYDYLVKGYERDDYATFDQFTYPSVGLGGTQNLRFSLSHGWGGRASLKFLKHFPLVDVYFEPYIRYWHINASKVASGTVLFTEYIATANKNATIEAGSSFGILF